MAERKTGSRRSQVISSVVTLLVLVVVFAYVLPKLGDYDQAIEAIRDMATSDLVLYFLFTIANILIYVFPYMAALPGLRYGPGFVIRQTSFLISNAVPGGGALGLGVQYAMLKSYGFKGAVGSSAIVLTSAWNLLATISLPGIAAIGLLLTGNLDSESALAALLGVTIAAVSLAGFILTFKSEKLAEMQGAWLDRTVKRLAGWFKKTVITNFKRSISEFRASSYEVTVQRWPWLATSNYLQQLAQFSVLYVAISALQPGAIGLVATLAAFAVARLGSFIPLTPGGIGTVDALMVSLLVQNGVANDNALAAVLLWRFATLFPQLLIGLFTFLYWRWQQRHKPTAT